MSKKIFSTVCKKLKQRYIGQFFACILGVTAVEFAMVAPVFFGLTYGVIETGRFFYVKTALQNAVDQSGRFITINSAADSAAIINYAKARVLSGVAGGATFTVSSDTVGTTDFTTVAAVYDFKTVLKVLPIDTVQISVLSRVPISN